MTAAERAAARKARWNSPEHAAPTAVILSVRLDNGDFEASVNVPLSEAKNFDTHVGRWLKLVHAALQHGVEEMEATLSAGAETGET